MSGREIVAVTAWEVLDSRGKPTVACRIELEGGVAATVAVPSGASTGRHEARERRDGGRRYGGNGVRDAVAAVNGEIAAALVGRPCPPQDELDRSLRELDGTSDLGRLGANAALAVSLARLAVTARAAGDDLWQVLDPAVDAMPRPMVNIVSGGAHAQGMISIQDVLFVPLSAATFAEAVEQSAEVRAAAASIMDAEGHSSALVADEGGLAAAFASSEHAIDLVVRAMERVGLTPGADGGIAVDVAASQFASDDGYVVDGDWRSPGDWLATLDRWTRTHPLVLVEDPFDQDDWPSWQAGYTTLATTLVADDLTATQPSRVRTVVETRAAGTLLVKVNQAGTVSSAKESLDIARSAGLGIIVSARSGETEDAWLADLAVGWRADLLKVGSTTRSERTAKWNRVMQIEIESGTRGLRPLPVVMGGPP